MSIHPSHSTEQQYRKSSIEVCRAVRAVDKLVRDELLLDELRVIDVMEESGADVILHLRRDPRHRMSIDGNSSVFNLATNSSAKNSDEWQTYWTCCLAELVKLFLDFSPESVRLAWELVASRINGVLPEESKQPQIEHEQLYIWWRNYLVFACAAVPHSECMSPSLTSD